MEGSASKKLKAFNESLQLSCAEVWPAGEARAVIKKMSERNKERSAWLLDEDLVDAMQTVMHDTMAEATEQLLEEVRLVVEERNVVGLLNEVAELERLGKTEVEPDAWAAVVAVRREAKEAEAKRWRQLAPPQAELDTLQAQLVASRTKRMQVTAASKTLASRVGQAALTPEAIKASEWSDRLGSPNYLPNAQRKGTKKARKK